jgi:Domain of unknown function (DUF4145)
MKDIPFTPTSHKAAGFNCAYPNLRAFADQYCGTLFGMLERADNYNLKGFDIDRCARCQKESIWLDASNAPPSNKDLPPDILTDYSEAGAILAHFPRGAAALLRFCIQKLCQHLGESGKDLNTDIGALVKKGLPPRVQLALDAVRVIGNNAAHPGQIDLTADVPTAAALFGLVSFRAQRQSADRPAADAIQGLSDDPPAVGIMAPIGGNHTFRATGITAYLANGGALDRGTRRKWRRTKVRAPPSSTTIPRNGSRRTRWNGFVCEAEGA